MYAPDRRASIADDAASAVADEAVRPYAEVWACGTDPQAHAKGMRMRVLVTGAAGFLGRGMVLPFEGAHGLRLMDVVDFESPHETMIGSVADLDDARRAVEGVDGIVIAHMASRQAGSYETPVAPFDVNVKGTANLLFAAVEFGVKRVALISSIGVVLESQRAGEFLTDETPMVNCEMYGLTKICQEVIARQYHLAHGIGVAALRPAYITDADDLTDKYGRTKETVNWQFIDRRDIGLAAKLALELDDLGFEVFYVLGPPEADEHADVARTRERLGWTPQHNFAGVPRDE